METIEKTRKGIMRCAEWLKYCLDIHYHPISYDSIGADEAHENWEPEARLEKMVDEFNEKLKELPPHSWKPGKIRTNYKLPAHA